MNRFLSEQLNIIAENYRLEGNTFRYKAYKKASSAIDVYDKTINSGAQARNEIEGIGSSIENTINALIKTGKSDRFTEDNKYNTIKLFESIHGIGPVKALKLYKEGYRSIEDLKRAKLTNAQIIGLKYYEDFKLKIPRSEIDDVNNLFHELFDEFGVKWEIAGSYRRGKLESGDIDVLFRQDITEDGEPLYIKDIINVLGNYLIDNLTINGDTKYMGVFQFEGKPARRIDIRLIKPESYYYALLYFTGSEQLNVKMRNKAIFMGMTLNEYSLNGKIAKSEKDIFKYLNMKYLDPTER